MKIGIVDDMFIPLQGYLLKNPDVDLKVYVDGMPMLPELLDPTSLTDRQVTQVLGLHDFDDCDYIIAGDNITNGASAFCKAYYKDAHVMFYSQDIIMMENDRPLSNRLLQRHGVFEHTALREIPSVQFSTQEDAEGYLSQINYPVVIKVNLKSVNQHAEERTLIVTDPENFEFPANNPWFKDGLGGCVIENYIEGQEVSFGMWHHHEKGWIGLPYYYVEHKGAWNGDLGGVLTGEVGTTLSYFRPSAESRIMAMFNAMSPIFAGKCNGMIDFNTRMVIENGVPVFYLMEFTMRFGRPTLELQLAAIRSTGKDAAHVITSWMRGEGEKPMPEYCRIFHNVGVCGFSYGLPVLNIAAQYVADHGIDPQDMLKLSPSYGTSWSESDFYTNMPGQNVLPMFGIFRHSVGAYVIDKEERHFMAVGSSENCATAIEKAYAILENVKLKGIVWRDDIGSSLESLTHVMGDCM